MENIKHAISHTKDIDQLIGIMEGLDQDSIAIKWYGSRRLKHKGFEGSVAINDLWLQVIKMKPQAGNLQKAAAIIKKLDSEATQKLKSKWLARKLHFLPHLIGLLFYRLKKLNFTLIKSLEPANKEKEPPVNDPSKGQKNKISVRKSLLPSCFDEHLFFQIHAGRFGELPRQKPVVRGDPALNFVHAFLAEKNKTTKDPQITTLIGKLEKAKALSETIKTGNFEEMLLKDIKEAFETKAPLLIPGGWAEGYAMYYEVIPTSKTEATFRYYDIPSTPQGHADGFTATKHKVAPYLDLAGVTLEKLSSPEFRKAVKEMLTYKEYLPRQNQNEKGRGVISAPAREETNYTANDVYEGLKKLLEPKLNASSTDAQTTRLMSPPELNVSPFRSLMAVLATELPRQQYKQLKTELKIESLLMCQEHLANQETPETRQLRVLEKSVVKVSRSIEKLTKLSILDQATAKAALEILKPVSEWTLASAKPPAALPDPSSLKKTDITSFQPLSSPPHLKQELDSLKNQSAKEPSNPALASKIKEFSLKIKQGDITCFPEIEALCRQAWDEKDYLSLQVGLQQLFFALPSDYPFWTKAFNTPEKAKQGIVHLGTLGDYYFKTCFMTLPAQTVNPEKQVVLLIIQSLQQHFVKSLSPGSEYYPYLHFDRGTSIPDKDTQEKLDEYSRFKFQEYRREESFFEKIFFHGGSGTGTSLFYYNNERKGYSIQAFQKLCGPEFDKECHEAFKKWNAGKQETYLSYLQFYASEAPPSWIKSLRDIGMRADALKNIPLNVTADPAKPFKLIYETRIHMDAHILSYKLDGIKTPLRHSDYSHHAEEYTPEEDRHLLLSRPFVSKKLQSLYKHWVNISQVLKITEKDWLTQDPKDFRIDMLQEEYQELMQLFGNGGKVNLIAIVDYFTKHPEKFKDPDFQTIFQKQLFRPGIGENLADVLKRLPDTWKTKIPQQIATLLTKNYQQMSLANEIQPAVFLLQMMRYLNKFMPGQKLLQPDVELQKLLLREGLDNDEKSAIYAELCSSASEKGIGNEAQGKNYLQALLFLERNPVPEQWRDPYVEESVRKSPRLLFTQLEPYISKLSSDSINEFVRTLYPDATDRKWELNETGPAPYFTSGTSQYFPLQGVLFLEGQKTLSRPLPKAILDSPGFAEALPSCKTGKQVAPFIYSADLAGKEVLIKYSADSQKIVIEQNIDGKWATLVHKNKLLIPTPMFEIISLLKSKALAGNFTAWEIPELQLLYLTNPKTGEILYKCQNKEGRLTITRLADNAVMSNPSELMQGIEIPDYIHEWYEGETLKEIELPRFKLTFTKDPDRDNRFYCQQYPGFYLNTKEQLPKLKVGAYSKYLIIENGVEKKAIFPKYKFTSAGFGLDPMVPVFGVDNSVSTFDHFVYDITKDGLLRASTLEENLYAAEVFILTQSYQQAANYLRKFAFKLRPYSQKEADLLEHISHMHHTNKDQDPNAKALRTYASYLLLKNGKRSTSHLNLGAENLRYYLSNLQHVTALKLSKEEEIFLLKTLLDNAFDPVFYLRLKTLDPSALALKKPPELTPPLPPKKPVEFKFPSADLLQRIAHLHSTLPPVTFDQTLFTRLEIELQNNFFAYYELARNGTEKDRQWLSKACLFNRFAKKNELCHLLEVVLKYHKSFPAFKPGLQNSNDYSWFKGIVEKAEELYAKSSNVFAEESPKEKMINLIEEGIAKETLAPKSEKVNFTLETAQSWGELGNGLLTETPSVYNKKTAAEINALFKTWQPQSPAMSNEMQHLTHDLESLEALPLPPAYRLKDSSITDIESLLTKEQNQTTLADLEKKIVQSANKQPTNEEELLLHELQLLSGAKKPLTLEELLIQFGKQDTPYLQQRNKALTNEDIAALYGKIGNYLSQATHEQQRVRCLNIVKQIKASVKGSLEETELVQQLGESLYAERCYDPKVNPAYLVFEYYLNIKIRERQKNKFTNLEPDTVIQMLMGEGKTTVLFQLLGELRADGKHVSLLVLPEPLFTSVGSYSQKVHAEAFGKQLRTLYFDRNSAFTSHTLEVILDNLRGAINDRECLITTSKSISCLILKYVEQCILQNPEKERGKEIRQMDEIMTLLGKLGYPLIDEIDTILRVMHEISFSTGDLVPVAEIESATIAELYDILYNDPEIKKLNSIESNPDSSATAPSLTQDSYHKNVKEKLANRFIGRLFTMKFESKELQKKVQDFGASLQSKERKKEKELLFAYLVQNKELMAETGKFYDALDPDIQDIVALASEEICRFLPYTLVMNCDENYGDGGEMFASPFEAADTPSIGSEFKNSHILMNTTFQMYVKNGIPEKAIIRVLDQLQQQALREIQDDPALDITNTNAWKAFNKIKGDLDFPLLKYNQVQLKALETAINKDSASKIRFVINAFLPHLKRYDGSLTLNPQNLIAFFDQGVA